MKYEYKTKKLLKRNFVKPDDGDFEIHHALENEMVIDVRGNLQYTLTHILDVLEKHNRSRVLSLHLAFLYEVSELTTIDLNMFKTIIHESFEKFSEEYYSLVDGHSFEEKTIPLEDRTEHFLKTVSDYLSSHLN